MNTTNLPCPCGLNKNYSACCGLYISGHAFAPTPEALMRSRYTAFSLANTDYIAATMKAPANNDFNAEQTRAWAKSVTWLGLEVLESCGNYVEFKATFNCHGKNDFIHEKSEFRNDDGRWFYVNGEGPRKRKRS